MLSFFSAILAAGLLAGVPVAAAAPDTDWRPGRVTHVADGSTLDILLGAERVRIRLAGIEVPAEGQAYSLRARQSLIAICGGEAARVKTAGKDRSGAVLAQVTCNGRDANAEQVRLGLARTSSGAAPPVRHAEDEAKAARRGIWAPPAPQQR